ncbi:MAG: hypothetical protein HON94_10060 [Methylococcales bacterium]|jgi:general secretion pathway protein C|nr:hypothetical protein [Methylococcales bacterium]MBT7411217.1 hypothetical protein [Methylococcales bacterium]
MPFSSLLQIKFAIVITTLTSITFLSYVLANVSWVFDQKLEMISVVPNIISAQYQSVSAKQALTGQANLIASSHLFGLSTAKVATQYPLKAPKTKLRLILKGVFSSDSPSQSWAIIAKKHGDDKFYHINEKIQANTTLAGIFPSYVLLKRNSKFEALYIKIDKHTDSTIVQKSSHISSGRQQTIDNIRQQFMNNPNNINKMGRIEYASVNGKFTGIRVYPSRSFKNLGIQSGDIVKEINGVSLNSPLQALKASQILLKASSINAVILRNGQEVSFSHTFMK